MTGENKKPRKAFKDYFDRNAAQALADQVGDAWRPFDRKRYVKLATKGLETLEFHGRVQQFAHALSVTLPSDIPRALDILARSLPPPFTDCDAVTDGWRQWPLGQFIADHGLPHFEESVLAMIELTQRFSSEFAVRPFIEAYPDKMYPRLYKLTEHENPHVRRWCSEGSRPRLPWGKRLQALINDPAPSWPILKTLKDDPELYVRKSVANHLNDIAKDHPALVIEHCRTWKKKAPSQRWWVIRHGLRTLIKTGHPEALALLGFDHDNIVSAHLKCEPRNVPIGGAIHLKATLHNPGATGCRVAVDYAVHFVRPSGKYATKIFKWTTQEMAAGHSAHIQKRHPLKHTSIRTLYPGRHRMELQVNGKRLAEATFTLA